MGVDAVSDSVKLNERNRGLDVLRVLAAVSVVIIHVAAAVTTNDSLLSSAGVFWWVATFLDSFARFSVPAFVVFTGYGTYQINRSEGDAVRLAKYQGQALKVTKITLFWSLCFIAWTLVRGDYADQSYSLKLWLGIIKPMIAGLPYFHLWYLFMVIPLLLMVPYLVNVIDKVEIAKRPLVLLVSAIFCLLFSLQNYYYENQLIFIFWFVEYIFYFIFGYFLSTIKCQLNKPFLCVVVAVCVLINAVLTYNTIELFGSRRGQYFFDFVSPLVMAQTICMFLLFVDLKAASIIKVTKLVPYTLGVYVIHPFITESLSDAVIGSHSVLLMLGAILISVIGSIALIALFKRVRFLNGFV